MAARARTHIKSTTCHDTSVKRTGAGGGRRCSLLRAQAAGEARLASRVSDTEDMPMPGKRSGKGPARKRARRGRM